MSTKTVDSKLAGELQRMLGEDFPGLTVEVAHADRWDRPCATFRWAGFSGLLLEERFHRLAQFIPEEFRASRMKGVVWVELAPGETVDDVLTQPRSEDVENREAEIYAGMAKARFFDGLAGALTPTPKKGCPGDFSTTDKVLRTAGLSSSQIRDTKLTFIRYGAYCDCQALLTVRGQLAKRHPKV